MASHLLLLTSIKNNEKRSDSIFMRQELHKAPKWKNLLKGVADEFNKPLGKWLEALPFDNP
jgi:hypothetical protein